MSHTLRMGASVQLAPIVLFTTSLFYNGKQRCGWSHHLGVKRAWFGQPGLCSILNFVRLFSAILALTFLAQPALQASEKQYLTATIVDVQQKTTTRILYYVVDTPITKDDPYFEVSVQLKNIVYVGRYVPRHADDTLPDEWVAGATVQARVDGRHLFVKRPGGNDVDFAIEKHTAVKPGEKISGPAPPVK